MPSTSTAEHFVTLFDSKFLPLGLALHGSLLQHAMPFHLWILCMDELVETQLAQLALPYVTLIPLRDIEVPALLSVKPARTRGEYCWTVTSFTFAAVFARDAAIPRVTYLDADVFFFRNPNVLFEEFSATGKDVLITEHAYAPEYDLTAKAGRFCVQFLTSRNTPEARKVLDWWQRRCLEWCFARAEDGKYGDQKYLDEWPSLFADEVHISGQAHETLGPWNVRSLLRSGRAPVFHHFHGLRIVHRTRVVLYSGYRIGAEGERLYREYMAALGTAVARMESMSMPVPTLPQTSLRERLKTWKNTALRRHKFARLA